MAIETNILLNQITEHEKITIVDKALKIPGCPIPPEVVRSLTKELKLDLFDKLVEGGAIKYTPPEPEQENRIPSNYQEIINNASFNERKEFWKDTPAAERMDKWRNATNAVLSEYTNDPTQKAAQTFLKKILKRDDQNLDEVEVTADTLYYTFIGGEGAGDVEYFVRQIIEKTDCNTEEIEQNLNLITKLGSIYGINSGKIAREAIQGILNAKNNPVPIDYHTLYSIIGTDLNENIDIAISLKARLQTTYLIGASGSGKTTLVANLVNSDIKSGLGVAVLDPHGDLIKTIIAGLPGNRVKDVIYLNLEDVDHPYGLSLFECSPLTIRNMAKTASFLSHSFEKIWGVGNDTPRLMQNLRAVTRTLIENPGTTFAEIPLLYSNATVRNKMVANLSNPSIISYWEGYERMNPRDRYIYLESLLNKSGSFLDEPMIRNIFAQSKTTIDFRNIMDSSKILLVSLSPQYEEASRLIGAVILGKILLAAFSRADIPEDNRRQFNLYCDEFQRFATSDFATLISEARKFRIATTLSHQTLAQLDEANRAAAAAAGNLIVFRVSGEDAETLAKSFDTTPTKEIIGEEPIRAPVADVISHLVKRGHNDERVTRFARSYLTYFEDLIVKTTKYSSWQVYGEWPIDLHVYSRDIRRGRELLNESIYRCMAEKTANRQLSPLALYMLSVAQHDRSEAVFFPYINYYGILTPHYFQGFFKGKGVEVFGDPSFINKESDFFIESCRKKKKPAAIALVNLITELRYTMETLAKQPILVDTGSQYQPKYQNRTFADMENQIARDLTNQPNYQAKVKLLSGEHTIQTKNIPPGLIGLQLEQRIAQIQTQTRNNYCKPCTEVEREIRERQDRLKAVENKPNPTSAKAIQPQRTRRRRAEEIPPAWS